MHINFGNNIVPLEKQGEIEYILENIQNWRIKPDEIIFLRELAGGRSTSEVYELSVVRRNQKFLKILKVGPYNDLKKELYGYSLIENQKIEMPYLLQ